MELSSVPASVDVHGSSSQLTKIQEKKVIDVKLSSNLIATVHIFCISTNQIHYNISHLTIFTVCKPDFKMNFDTNSFRELSGSNMAFYVENAVTQNGAAKFRGNGKITIWGFMNKELGHDFAVRIRFKPFNTEGGYGMLVSNCGHEGLPTVEISMQDKKARLIAKSMHSSSPSVLEYHIVVSFKCSLKYLNYLVEALKILALKKIFFFISAL